jgi:hypothetical protein
VLDVRNVARGRDHEDAIGAAGILASEGVEEAPRMERGLRAADDDVERRRQRELGRLVGIAAHHVARLVANDAPERLVNLVFEIREENAERRRAWRTREATARPIGSDPQRARRRDTTRRRLSLGRREVKQTNRLGDDLRGRGVKQEHAGAIVVGHHPEKRVVRLRQGAPAGRKVDGEVEVRGRA